MNTIKDKDKEISIEKEKPTGLYYKRKRIKKWKSLVSIKGMGK